MGQTCSTTVRQKPNWIGWPNNSLNPSTMGPSTGDLTSRKRNVKKMRMSKYSHFGLLVIKAKASRITQLLGQVLCQKNVNALKNAKRSHKRNHSTVSSTTQPQDRSGETSSDDSSYSEFAKNDNRYDVPKCSKRKRTPSARMDDSKKRPKAAEPLNKSYGTCRRCRRLHSKCDGTRQCSRCTKAAARQSSMLSPPLHCY